MLAITKASLKAIFRSPQSVFFSVFFPVVLIVIFGAISDGGGISVNVGISKGTDTTNPVYLLMQRNPSVLNIVSSTPDTLEDKLKRGKITAIVSILKSKTADGQERYDVHLKSTSATQQELPGLMSILRDIISPLNQQTNDYKNTVASISVETVQGRIYKLIDFYLPGMIGFSLIGSAVFGVAFLFFSLRETLVLKRLYASPIKRINIILGETFSRIIFQVVVVVVLILFGTFFYHFTLANGIWTFIEMVLISILGLLVFMGVGFVISSVSKNQNVIPIYSNLFMFPQYFLSGTFFSSNALPKGLQPIIELLPLTALNESLRKISFEGAHLSDCWRQATVLGVWGIIVYFIAVKTFKWEQ